MKSKPVESTERCACPPNAPMDGMASNRPHANGTPIETNPPCTVLRLRAIRRYPAPIVQCEWRSDTSADTLPSVVAIEGKRVGLHPLAADHDAMVERGTSRCGALRDGTVANTRETCDDGRRADAA